jgi:hypothetical protein
VSCCRVASRLVVRKCKPLTLCRVSAGMEEGYVSKERTMIIYGSISVGAFLITMTVLVIYLRHEKPGEKGKTSCLRTKQGAPLLFLSAEKPKIFLVRTVRSEVFMLYLHA